MLNLINIQCNDLTPDVLDYAYIYIYIYIYIYRQWVARCLSHIVIAC